MAGYVTAAVAGVSLRPCTCRAAEQGFARTEAGSGGPSGRRQSFFYILIPAFFLGWRGMPRRHERVWRRLAGPGSIPIFPHISRIPLICDHQRKSAASFLSCVLRASLVKAWYIP